MLDVKDHRPSAGRQGMPASARARPNAAGLAAGAAGVAVGAALAMANAARAKRARARLRALFTVQVDGVRLRYSDSGSGPALVLLHGNGAMLEDFEASGISGDAAGRYRVIAFDRPGFGRSERPRGRFWTAAAQAKLIHEAAMELGLDRFIVLGHSWGASVALQCASRFPGSLSGAVLVSGYYYPTPRPDALLAAFPALPVLGTAIRHTVSPPATRLAWPLLMKKLFGPGPVPRAFSQFMREVATRPSQLRTTAAESGLLFQAALASAELPKRFAVPIGIVAGRDDRLIDTGAQSERLHRETPGSLLSVVPGAGHMVHHTAPEVVLEMIDKVAHSGAAAAASPIS